MEDMGEENQKGVGTGPETLTVKHPVFFSKFNIQFCPEMEITKNKNP
jgi:hypothetical protein